MQKVPLKLKLAGLDVSHYDETIDFTKVKAAGFEFCSAKATEGVSYVDNRFQANKKKAKAAGMIFGAYHFFRPGMDPKKQAEHFLAHADIEPGDFQPMFDWEVFQGKQDVAKAKIFLDAVEKATGKKCIIYGPPYALNDLNLGKEFLDYPLWVAHYGVSAPLIPAPWKACSFWQYTEKGSVPGIPAADEDMDFFNGTSDNVKKFVV